MSWRNVVERTVSGLGYELVDVERSGRGLRPRHDRPEAWRPASRVRRRRDCERVTRQLQHVLKVEGLAYERLEVSSPGLDRPLKKEADFRRLRQRGGRADTPAPLRGRKRFQGQLLAPDDAAGDGAGWRLVLAEAPVKAAAPSRRTKKTGPAAPPAVAAVAAEPASDAVLEFRLDEVREAHLVPVVDFKGRRFLPAGPAGAAGATPNDEEAAR